MSLTQFCKFAYLAGALVALLALASCMSPSPSREERKLDKEMSTDLTPQWSPDGKTVVSYADYQLYAASVDGNELRRITKPRHGRHFQSAFSPDGRLAYVNNSGSWLDRLFGDYLEYSVNIADFEGRRIRVRHTVPIDFFRSVPGAPNWSPDGAFLAYSRGDYTVILNGEGKEIRRYFHAVPEEWIEENLSGRRSRPVWSNSSQRTAKTAYSKYGGGQVVVTTDRPDRAEPLIVHRITDTGIHPEISTPAWSLDDQRIYFAMRKGNEKDAVLYSVRTDGTKLETLATLEASYYREVKTSPNGDQLLLISRRAPPVGPWEDYLLPNEQKNGTGLWIINADGTDLRQLRRGYLYASWSPDGNRIAVVDIDTKGKRGSLLYTIGKDDTSGSAIQPLLMRDQEGEVITAQGEKPKRP